MIFEPYPTGYYLLYEGEIPPVLKKDLENEGFEIRRSLNEGVTIKVNSLEDLIKLTRIINELKEAKMTTKQKIIPIPELLALLDKHVDIFECAQAIVTLQEETHKLVQQDARPSDEEMESFSMLVEAINFISMQATAFIKELEEKDDHAQIN